MGNCILTKGGMSGEIKLLWTNPSLTSTFAAQTIQLDLSKYQLIGIALRSSTGDPNYAPPQWFYNPCSVSTYLTYIGNCHRQLIAINDYGVQFGVGGAGSGTDNNLAIPYQIYGMSETPIVHHITDYNFYGIDTSNVIANAPTLPYTATQDCGARVYIRAGGGTQGAALVNGVIVAGSTVSGDRESKTYHIIPLKQGDVISTSGAYESSVVIYGLQ